MLAYRDASSTTHGTGYFAVFWIGVALFVIPAAVRLVRADTSERERLGLLVLLGLFMFLPKFLRDPSMPLYHDELAHWRQAQEVISTGSISQPNYIISIIRHFPGLESLTAGLSLLMHTSVWETAVALLALLHVLALLGVAELGRVLTRGSSRTGAVAALLYALNPSYMFFDTQFSYESLSIVLFIWTIVTISHFADPADRDSRNRGAWLCAGAVLGAASVVTHHLAMLILLAFLIVACASTAVLSPTDGRRITRRLAYFTAFLGAATALWDGLVATDVISYLEPTFTRGFSQLGAVLHQGKGSRTLFGKSTLPFYERWLGVAAVPIVAVGSLAGLRELWVSRRELGSNPLMVPLTILGLTFFASLPLVLSASGAEGAHRSWAYSFVGLSILIAAVVVRVVDGRVPISPSAVPLLRGALLAAFLAVLIGMVGAGGSSADYRFPGPYIWGSDTRSLDPELLGLAHRFLARFGPGQKLVADRYSSLALAAFGRAHTAQGSPGFPIWELYFDKTVPPHLLSELRSSQWRFVVVDERMSSVIPLTGTYISSGERAVGDPVVPPSRAALAKFDSVPWAHLVMSTQHYRVYELNPARLTP